MKDNFAGLKRASRAAYRRHRLNHTETTTDLKVLPDGLYQVTKYQVCAGFVIEGGKLVVGD